MEVEKTSWLIFSRRVAAFLATWLAAVVLGFARGHVSQMHLDHWYALPFIAALSVGMGIVTVIWIPVFVVLAWILVRFTQGRLSWHWLLLAFALQFAEAWFAASFLDTDT